MPNRIIKESITTSETVNNLSWEAECFFYRLIVCCDDYGRMDGRIPVLLAKCFPLRLHKIKDTDIRKWMRELISGEFITMYRIGTDYLQVNAWGKHQQIRNQRSKYPSIEDDGAELISIDIKSNQLITDVTVIQSNPNPIRTKTTPSAYDYFSIFWKIYPRKKSKGDAEKAFAKIPMNDQMMDVIVNGLYRAIDSENWNKENKKYIPYPATWIRAKGWEDEF